jgi:hypothetical protein
VEKVYEGVFVDTEYSPQILSFVQYYLRQCACLVLLWLLANVYVQCQVCVIPLAHMDDFHRHARNSDKVLLLIFSTGKHCEIYIGKDAFNSYIVKIEGFQTRAFVESSISFLCAFCWII